jgi:hypothetical protein
MYECILCLKQAWGFSFKPRRVIKVGANFKKMEHVKFFLCKSRKNLSRVPHQSSAVMSDSAALIRELVLKKLHACMKSRNLASISNHEMSLNDSVVGDSA